LLASGMVLGAGGVDQTGVNVLASAELFSSPADLAAQLVADSTGKGPGKALANEASGIRPPPTPGRRRPCAQASPATLASSKRRPGKKLTVAQANQLTTQATDLADTVGC